MHSLGSPQAQSFTPRICPTTATSGDPGPSGPALFFLASPIAEFTEHLKSGISTVALRTVDTSMTDKLHLHFEEFGFSQTQLELKLGSLTNRWGEKYSWCCFPQKQSTICSLQRKRSFLHRSLSDTSGWGGVWHRRSRNSRGSCWLPCTIHWTPLTFISESLIFNIWERAKWTVGLGCVARCSRLCVLPTHVWKLSCSGSENKHCNTAFAKQVLPTFGIPPRPPGNASNQSRRFAHFGCAVSNSSSYSMLMRMNLWVSTHNWMKMYQADQIFRRWQRFCYLRYRKSISSSCSNCYF